MNDNWPGDPSAMGAIESVVIDEKEDNLEPGRYGLDTTYRAELSPDELKRNQLAVRKAIGGVELLVAFVHQETLLMRMSMRNAGLRFRRWVQSMTQLDYGRLGRLVALLINKSSGVRPVTFEGDRAMIFNEVPAVQSYRLPPCTLNELAAVLTTDEEVAQGIVHAYFIRSPKWPSLPKRIRVETPQDQYSEFQLFNKPLRVFPDDEDDRISLGTTVRSYDIDKLSSIEHALSSLAKQMAILTQQANMVKMQEEEGTSSFSRDGSDLSDDEGKGSSVLASPAASRKATTSVPPPAPPLPPSLIPSTWRQPTAVVNDNPLWDSKMSNELKKKTAGPSDLLSHASCESSTSGASTLTGTTNIRMAAGADKEKENVEKMEKSSEAACSTPPSGDVRSSVLSQIRNRAVQLRKTNADRSPGGTPMQRTPRANFDLDQRDFLKRALREKFQAVDETSFSETEQEDSSSWD